MKVYSIRALLVALRQETRHAPHSVGTRRFSSSNQFSTTNSDTVSQCSLRGDTLPLIAALQARPTTPIERGDQAGINRNRNSRGGTMRFNKTRRSQATAGSLLRDDLTGRSPQFDTRTGRGLVELLIYSCSSSSSWSIISATWSKPACQKAASVMSTPASRSTSCGLAEPP